MTGHGEHEHDHDERGFIVHVVETVRTRSGQKVRVALCGLSWTEDRTYWCQEADGTTWRTKGGTPILCPACEATNVLETKRRLGDAMESASRALQGLDRLLDGMMNEAPPPPKP